MNIDHIGYAVNNIDKAKKSMEALGYHFDETIEDYERGVVISFGELDDYRVELVAPMHDRSPVDMYLAKTGPAPYHICYKSADIETDIENLTKQRFKIYIPPTPAVAFGGRRVAFMYSLAVGLIELLEDG